MRAFRPASLWQDREVRGLVATTAAFVVVGCSIGALEGFSGGAGDPDASAVDSTTGADVTPTTDATVDADVAAGDAPNDTAGDAAAPFDCAAGTYLVCSTFDQGTVAAGWTG